MDTSLGDWRLCQRCWSFFPVEQLDQDTCVMHPGRLEERYTPERGAPEYDHSAWTCCGQRSEDAPGCRQVPHQLALAQPGPIPGMTVWPPSEPSSGEPDPDLEPLSLLPPLWDEAPDAHAWKALWLAMGTGASEATRLEALSQVLQHLTTWPDHLRLHYLDVEGLDQDPGRFEITLWRWPMVRHLLLKLRPVTVDALARRCHLLAGITCLTLEDHYGQRLSDDRLLLQLWTLPTLGGVEELLLDQHGITSVGLRGLAGSPHLRSLTSLGLSSCHRLQEPGLDALTTDPHWRRLERLQIHSSSLTPSSFARLASAPALIGLTRLELTSNGRYDNPTGDPAAAALASALNLPALTRLHLRNEGLKDPGALALAYAPALKRLEYLDLSHNHIGPQGVEALLSAPGTDGILSLNLSWQYSLKTNALAPVLQKSLARSSAIALRLAGNKLTGQGLSGLRALSRLKRLDLSHNALDSEVTLKLVHSGLLDGLEHLDLSHNPLDPEVVEAIRQREWPRMKSLVV